MTGRIGWGLKGASKFARRHGINAIRRNGGEPRIAMRAAARSGGSVRVEPGTAHPVRASGFSA